MTKDLDVCSRLQSSLAPGESLLWCGRPRQGVMFRKADALMIPFSVMWAGFAVFWVIGAKSSGAPAPFWSFGLIFVAIGLYLVVGRFVVDAMVRNKT